MISTPHPLRLLGLFAHPDDEVFCVGGTFAKYAATGAETMIVSFTKGEAGQIRDAAIATRRTLGSVRANELDLSCEALNIAHVRCLDFGDGKLSNLDIELLIEAAVELIREFKPDLVFTFDETGAYGHPDHITMCHVSKAACERAGVVTAHPSAGRPYAPTGLYYAVFPQNDRLLLRLIVQWLESLNTRFRGTDEFTHALMLFADESGMLGYAADHIEIEWYPRGFFVIEQGEPAVSLYLILSGSIDIYVEQQDGEMQYIETHGPGTFIGESGIAYNAPRNAHCIAAEKTTCLVFSPGAPTNFAGRGEEAQFTTESPQVGPSATVDPALVTLDVNAYIGQKVQALSQHHSQYPITPDLFPRSILQEVMGSEHFTLAWSTDANKADAALRAIEHTIAVELT